MGLLRAGRVEAVLRRGDSTRVDADVAAKFAPGDKVVARNIHPCGHTRLPRYARGHQGVIARDHGVFIFPDSHCKNWERKPQHVYAVRFTARELWGPQAHARDVVLVDMWDDYLDPAP